MRIAEGYSAQTNKSITASLTNHSVTLDGSEGFENHPPSRSGKASSHHQELKTVLFWSPNL